MRRVLENSGICEAQRIPYRVNQRRNTPRHTLIKLTKIKNKEKILKAARKKATNNIEGNPKKVVRCFFQKKLCRLERNIKIYLK